MEVVVASQDDFGLFDGRGGHNADLLGLERSAAVNLLGWSWLLEANAEVSLVLVYILLAFSYCPVSSLVHPIATFTFPQLLTRF